MASNSFLLKGWTVTLAAALVAVAAKETESRFLLVALLPGLAFWGLDAYYLRQERLFRRLYDDVRASSPSDLDDLSYSLSTKKYRRRCPGWFRCLWAPSTIVLHGVVITSLLAAIIILAVVKKGAQNGAASVL